VEFINYNETPEANFVFCLTWHWNGVYFESIAVPPAMYCKLRDVFRKWGIGWTCNNRGLKVNTEQLNVEVFKHQFDRFALVIPREKVICGVNIDYPWNNLLKSSEHEETFSERQ
jgi:hypothetical protein